MSVCTRRMHSLPHPTAFRALPAAGPSIRALHVSPRALESKKKRAKEVVTNPEAMNIPDAIFLLKAVEVARPNNAFELHVATQFKKGEAPLRGRIALPREARTKEEKILVFAEGEQADQAKEAGATWVGGQELVQDVLDNKIQPTKVVCTPMLLPSIAKLGRTLGPKGIMPTAKRGTVTDDVAAGVREAGGALSWKGDKLGIVRAAVARIHFPTEDVETNIKAFLESVKSGGGEIKATSYEKAKTYDITKVHLSSTQGPGIELKDYQ